MGFGDVKFLAAIGAFLGWEATVFTVAAASCLGTGYGLVTLLMGKRKWPPLPFAPYLTGARLRGSSTGRGLWKPICSCSYQSAENLRAGTDSGAYARAGRGGAEWRLIGRTMTRSTIARICLSRIRARSGCGFLA